MGCTASAKLVLQWPFDGKKYKTKPNIGYIFDIVQYDSKNASIPQDQWTDINKLENYFNEIGFHIYRYSSEQGRIDSISLLSKLKKFVRADFTEVNSVLIYFGGHGSRTGFITSDSIQFLYDDIMDCLVQNPTLQGKLKFFIFACCHGPKFCEAKAESSDSFKVTRTIITEATEVAVKLSRKDTLVIFGAALGTIGYSKMMEEALTQVNKEIKEIHQNVKNHEVLTLVKFTERLNFYFDKIFQKSSFVMSEISSSLIKDFPLQKLESKYPIDSDPLQSTNGDLGDKLYKAKKSGMTKEYGVYQDHFNIFQKYEKKLDDTKTKIENNNLG